MKFSDYFTLEELTASASAARRGLDNTPTEKAKCRLKVLANALLDPIRRAHGAPVLVTSGYRSPAVNDAVGGSRTSDHVTGQAADIRAPGMTSQEFARFIVGLDLQFDQLVWYTTSRHVHISFRSGRNRGQILKRVPGGYRSEMP